jgi:malonate transporter and related proteins
MLSFFLALAPVFLLIFIGHALKRWNAFDGAFWVGAERLTYFILFPALLTQTLAAAKIPALTAGPMALAMMVGVFLVTAIQLAFRRAVPADGPSFTSIYQGSVRPNTYVGLAVAAGAFGKPAISIAAICVAATVPLVNLLSVAVLGRYAGASAARAREVALAVATNPLILSCLLGILLNVTGIGLPPVIEPLLVALGSASLPLGLLAVGAGLDLGAARRAGVPVGIAASTKLLLLPLLTGSALWLFGVSGLAYQVALLYAALPCSASAYVLSRQMGGDAPLMAGIITAQTLAAVVSMPLVLTLIG